MGKWSTYGVHTLTLALRMMGHDVKRIIDTGSENAHSVTIEFFEGRKATLDVRYAANQWDFCPWSFAARSGENYVGAKVEDHEGFYVNLLKEVCSFFKTGQVEMSVHEALITVKCLEAAEQSRLNGGVWVAI